MKKKCQCFKKGAIYIQVDCDKCGYESCVAHRYHDCPMAKEQDRKKIEEQNPKLEPEKIEKI